MDGQAGLPLWVLLAVPFLGLVAVTVLRWVSPGERLVVLRRGVVARLHGPGPAWRLPWVEQDATHAEEMPGTPVAVRARTRDGRRVFLGLEADLATLPAVVGRRYVEPAATAEEVIARVVSDSLARIDVRELPEGLVAQLSRLCDEADRTTRPDGVAVTALQVSEIDVIIDVDDADDPRDPDTDTDHLARGPD